MLAWVRGEVQQSRSILERRLFSRIRLEYGPTLTPAVTAALRERIKDKPDHPEWRTLKQNEGRLAEGPKITESWLWYGSGDQWRGHGVAIARPEDTVATDSAVNGREAWVYVPTERMLVLSRLGATDSQSGQPTQTHESSVDLVARLMFAYLPTIAGQFSTPPQVSRTGDRIVLTFVGAGDLSKGARMPDGARRELVVRWAPEYQRGFVEETRVHGYPDGPHVDRFEGWFYETSLGVWAARRLTPPSFGAPGDFRAELLELRALEQDELDRVTRPITVGTEDAVLGKISPVSVIDRRSGVRRSFSIGPDGSWIDADSGRALAQLPTSSGPPRWPALVFGAIVVAGVVWWRARPRTGLKAA